MQTVTMTMTIPFTVTEDEVNALQLYLSSPGFRGSIAMGVGTCVGREMMQLVGLDRAMGVGLNFTDATVAADTKQASEEDMEVFRQELARRGTPPQQLHDMLVRDAQAQDARQGRERLEPSELHTSKAQADAFLAGIFKPNGDTLAGGSAP